ncbi:VanZ family protein [Haloferula sargassicola]|uniref:VanZ-like domain-containing protein n=1 Tax=Haloferula sargassicola TaxID=490096 RepID=A0ABP9UQR1_9BACT
MIRHRSFWYGAFVAWIGTLWWLSSGIRHLPQPDGWVGVDKLYHFGYFFGGAGLLAAAVSLTLPGGFWKRFAVVVAVVSLVGISDEVHQSFVPGRSGNDPFDFSADFLGACAGFVVFESLRRRVFPDPEKVRA